MNFGARGCAFDCCTRDEGRMMIPRVASAEQMNLEPQSRARMRGGGGYRTLQRGYSGPDL